MDSNKNDLIKRMPRIIGFVFLFFCLLTVTSLFFRGYVNSGYQYEDVQNKLSVFNAEDEQTLDVVFVGDSTAWAAYSPEYFYKFTGIASYNCATTGQWIGDSGIVIENVLKKQSPELIVVDANALYTRLSRAKYLLSKYFPVFHYHFARPVETVSEKDVNRGYYFYENSAAYTGNSDYMYEMPITPFSSLALEKMDEVYELCRNKGIQLIVVSSPNPTDWNMGKHQAVQQWCDSHEIEYIDYNLKLQEIGIDWNTDTRDGGEHLNNSGAYKVCEHLSKKLQESYNLPDHRNDPLYGQWNADYGEAES